MIPVVVDTNILLSALLNPNGKEADLLFNAAAHGVRLFSCHFLHIEVLKHKSKILKLSGLTESDYLELLHLLARRIEFIDEGQVPAATLDMALALTMDVDRKDAPFVALALHLGGIVWTGEPIAEV